MNIRVNSIWKFGTMVIQKYRNEFSFLSYFMNISNSQYFEFHISKCFTRQSKKLFPLTQLESPLTRYQLKNLKNK